MTKNVLEWLENDAEVRGNKTAFIDPDGSITFAELKEKAKRCGSWLAVKIQRCDPVSFYMEKSITALKGMFGTVYAGGFYSFLDTRQPAARLNKVLDILEPKVILTDRGNYEKAVEMFKDRCEIACIEDIEQTELNEPLLSLRHIEAQDIDPLYVNFTSGSTGTPKGVTVSHRSVIDFIEVFTMTFHIQENDILGNQAPFDFDVSVKDIFSGLYTGAATAVIPREYFSNPVKLMDYLCDNNITVLIWAVSAMCFVSIMNGFGYKIPSRIRLVMFSGEVMPIKQLNKWKEALPEAIYVNLYGPTEITCNCTYHILENRKYDLNETIPIGYPFPNEKVFLLDEDNHEINKPGIKGEICVSGTCLALGYYRDRKKTEEVFTQNPLNDRYAERIYHTGDTAMYLKNGELVYSGRMDFQIKHLGHRIELGEIEAQVQAVDGISRACCIYNQEKKRIILFYTGEVEGKQLLGKLRQTLPPFMLPNKCIQLEQMPMTKNGKIDRAVLKGQAQ